MTRSKRDCRHERRCARDGALTSRSACMEHGAGNGELDMGAAARLFREGREIRLPTNEELIEDYRDPLRLSKP